MDKQGLLNKISFILQDLKGQHLKLTGNVDRIPEIELELFMANARYLLQHLEVLNKVNGNTIDVKARDEILKNILRQHNESINQNLPVEEPLTDPRLTIEAEADLKADCAAFVSGDTLKEFKSSVPFENKQGVFAPELERRAAMLAAQNAAEREVREREAASRLLTQQREQVLVQNLANSFLDAAEHKMEQGISAGFNTHIPVREVMAEHVQPQAKVIEMKLNYHTTADWSYAHRTAVQSPASDNVSEREAAFVPAPVADHEPAPVTDREPAPVAGQIASRPEERNTTGSYQPSLAGIIQGRPALQADSNFSSAADKGSGLFNTIDRLPVKDIRKAVGLNEHLLFIKTLFNGDPNAYDRTLTAIDSLKNSVQARDFINNQIAIEFNWETKKAVAELFKNIVSRKFSRN